MYFSNRAEVLANPLLLAASSASAVGSCPQTKQNLWRLYEIRQFWLAPEGGRAGGGRTVGRASEAPNASFQRIHRFGSAQRREWSIPYHVAPARRQAITWKARALMALRLGGRRAASSPWNWGQGIPAGGSFSSLSACTPPSSTGHTRSEHISPHPQRSHS